MWVACDGVNKVRPYTRDALTSCVDEGTDRFRPKKERGQQRILLLSHIGAVSHHVEQSTLECGYSDQHGLLICVYENPCMNLLISDDAKLTNHT